MPAASWTLPWFPAPLDDVYIYFDFARSTGRGCVLCWTEQSGLSSGATSPPYALVLAAGWLIGFRGAALGAFAGIVACLSLVDALRSIADLAPHPRYLAWLGPVALAGVPLLAWTWMSGMEAAFVAAVAGRALRATQAATLRAPASRRGAQWIAGGWIALLAWSRPELVPLAGALAVTVAHGAGSLSAIGSLARAGAPAAAVLGSWALVLFDRTGEAAAAGAIRKLVTSDPYASGADVAAVVVKNAVRLYTEGVEGAFGGRTAALSMLVLGLCSLTLRGTRRLGAALMAGSSAAFVLVCFNTTAPFQNLRYLAPVWLTLIVAALLGIAALARHGRRLGGAAALACLLTVACAAQSFPRQVDHFARASKNIAEQQLVVGRQLAARGARRVFVGDAGAIPYASDLPAIDGLGLGGYHRLPFARASVHGTPAVLELIERLPEDERPDVLAIYDGWWPGVGARFGRPWFRVRIDDNIMCGDPEKAVYRADWTLFEDRAALEAGALDRLDVADLVDERAHEVELPRPRAGYVVDAVLSDARGRPTWDAGRLLAEGQSLAFSLRGCTSPCERAEIVVVTDGEAAATIEHRGRARQASPDAGAGERWRALRAPVEALSRGDRIRIAAGRGPLRVFSVVVVPPGATGL